MNAGALGGANLTAVLTPHDNFPGRSATRFGVGELVDLSYSAVPTIASADVGGLIWFISSGGGTLTGTGGNDGTGLFTAPPNGGLTILDLKVASGPNAGMVVATCTITTVEPSDAVMVQEAGTGILHINGTWSCAFLGVIYLRPTDVSFTFMQMGEGSAAAVANGFLSGLNGIVHSPGPMCTVGTGDINQGCKVNTEDHVITGELNQPFSQGDFLWAIPWQFSVGGSGATQFTVAEHRATADDSGQATISKKSAGPFSRLPTDPTAGF
jgi:hypothetical protein